MAAAEQAIAADAATRRQDRGYFEYQNQRKRHLDLMDAAQLNGKPFGCQRVELIMDPLGDHLINIETMLNGHLGFTTPWPLDVGDALHQFVFLPTFHPPSTLILEQSASGTTAYFAFLHSSASTEEAAGCWQDIRAVDPDLMTSYSTTAGIAKPWELPNVVTNSRDGILAGYRIQTTERSARFYAFNPIDEEHPGQIAWLKQGLRMAREIFRSADAERYLGSLSRYFGRA